MLLISRACSAALNLWRRWWSHDHQVTKKQTGGRCVRGVARRLPLASVLLGAPQVGGAIYLVEKALGTKIIKVGKTDYRIEGSFDDPQVSLLPPFVKQRAK